MNPDQFFIIDIRPISADGEWIAPEPLCRSTISARTVARLLVLLADMSTEKWLLFLEEHPDA